MLMSPSPKDEKAFFEKLLAEDEAEGGEAGGSDPFVDDPDQYLLVDKQQVGKNECWCNLVYVIV